ncbi:methyl-accepting chemotaxis protein [Derxia lacustris]|uniref:methyl-accepting chemotaxis protein n=1 Tax=Derxia lacustris TaxID=764842 RepID=UPI0015942D5E|nr:methyl-accepting chemotaxis protein [Derxia lacustris]
MNVLQAVLAPAVGLMRQLSLQVKLVALGLLWLLPTLLLTSRLVAHIDADYEVAAAEHAGLSLAQQVFGLRRAVYDLRGAETAQDAAARQAAADRLDSGLAAMSTTVAAGRIELTPTEWSVAETQLRALLGSGNALRNAGTALGALQNVLQLIGERSSLVLDPAAPSYFLMELSILHAGDWAWALSDTIAAARNPTLAGGIELRLRADRLERALDLIERSTQALLRSGEQSPAHLAEAIETSRVLIASLGGERIAFETAARRAEQSERAAVDAIVARLDVLLAERCASALATERGAIGVAVVVNLGLMWLLTAFRASVIGSLREVQQAVDATARGDLAHQVKVAGKDEFAQIGASVEHMNARLSALVADIRSNAVMVAQSGFTLAEGTQRLSERTEQQAGSVHRTTASVEQMSGTVRANADSAEAVDRLAAEVRGVAEHGGSAMREVVTTIDGIQTSARQVRDIIGVIDGIAFQTNILALNAAVEAARAGEQGRGFAVVASEVRTLAQRSASAAREIKGLIEDSVKRVDAGVAQVSEVHRQLDSIVDGVRRVAENIETINRATAEQRAELSGVSEALGGLDDITRQNASMVVEANQASAGLGERAGKLAEAVAAFRLRQGTADEAQALVERAHALWTRNGNGCFAQISEAGSEWRDRDMYIFVLDPLGRYLACGGQPEKVGVSVLDIPNMDGEQVARDIARCAEHGGGWVDYEIVNPSTGVKAPKTSYVLPLRDGLAIGCGVYKTLVA